MYKLTENALLAQLDRVTGYEPVGRGFESLTAHQRGSPAARKALVEIRELFLCCFQ